MAPMRSAPFQLLIANGINEIAKQQRIFDGF
jgi:hypothetical protein